MRASACRRARTPLLARRARARSRQKKGVLSDAPLSPCAKALLPRENNRIHVQISSVKCESNEVSSDIDCARGNEPVRAAAFPELRARISLEIVHYFASKCKRKDARGAASQQKKQWERRNASPIVTKNQPYYYWFQGTFRVTTLSGLASV
jgi:hypothetical protein